MATVNDIIAFLTARYNEEEQTARQAALMPPVKSWRSSGNCVYDAGMPDDVAALNVAQSEWDEVAAHVALHDPARVLAEVDAKRRLLVLHPYAGLLSAPESCESCAVTPGPCPTLRLLALPHAGHPDFRDEWRPT
jgi:hypothetical protein